MLDHALDLLAPQGRLVYCTCSLEPEEGEAQIAACLARRQDVQRYPISLDDVMGCEEILTKEGDLRCLPSFWPDAEPRKAGMDGFFAARLRRL